MFVTYSQLVAGSLIQRSIPLHIPKDTQDPIWASKTILTQLAGYFLGPSFQWVRESQQIYGGWYKNDNGDALSITPFDSTTI